jgi:hypothetical protein
MLFTVNSHHQQQPPRNECKKTAEALRRKGNSKKYLCETRCLGGSVVCNLQAPIFASDNRRRGNAEEMLKHWMIWISEVVGEKI